MLSSQASINTIAQLVLQQLQQRMSPSLQNLSPIPFNVNSPLANSAATLTQAADTPLSRENSFNSTTVNAPLSRSNSNTSSCSGSSNDITAADLNIDMTSFQGDFEKDFENIVVLSRATGKRLYNPEDKVWVNELVMRKLDALLLAPLQSNLFRHKRKVGSSEFRKHQEIEFNYFKKIIRPVIREACAKNASGGPFLAQRFFWCAYDLVRKRRANHIQFWRRYGRPKQFIYGGKALYEATYGKLKPLPQKRNRKNRAVKQELFDQTKKIKLESGNDENECANGDVNSHVDDENECANGDINGHVDDKNDCANGDVSGRVDAENDRANKSDTGVDDEEDIDPFSNKFSDELCKELLYETRDCKRCKCSFEFNTNAFDPDQKDEKSMLCKRCLRLDDKCKCHDCGVKMKRGEAFPQSSIEWSSCPTVRCGECWEQHIKKVLPQIAESKIDKKNQSKKITACKKCGSTTHRTARSRWCPFNPNYNKFTQGNDDVDYFHFPLPNIPGEGVGGYFDPLTAPPSITPGAKAKDNTIRRPATPPPVHTDLKAPPPVPNKDGQRAKKTVKVLKMAPLVNHEDVHAVKIPFTGAPPSKQLRQKKSAFGSVRCYTIGSNVFAMFKKNQWFLAHVTARNGIKHDVYFPGDSQTMRGVTPDRLRPCPASCTAPTRRDMIGKEFEYEGDEDIPAGTVWKIRRVNTGNVFQCTKIRGEGRINCDDFDIGYVISVYREQQERTRENGPKPSRN